METKLIYLEDMNTTICEAQVVSIEKQEEKDVVFLNQTIFYPQGGGQPFDMGIISNLEKKFIVEEVRFNDGMVHHIGSFDGEVFIQGESVTCSIDSERRHVHSRIHSAGHVVDLAVKRLGLKWVPGKGYHFPNGPYIEYRGSLKGLDIEKFKIELESACNKIIGEDITTKVLFVQKEEMKKVCDFVPDFIPQDKPGRVVMFGNFGIPCGGTHVSNLKEIEKMTIRKIKQEGENIRVGYGVV